MANRAAIHDDSWVMGIFFILVQMAAMRRRFYGMAEFTNIHLFRYSGIANRSLNNVILRRYVLFKLTIFVKETSEIAAMIARENALHIDRRSEHISSKAFSSQHLSSCYDVSVLIHDRLTNSFNLYVPISAIFFYLDFVNLIVNQGNVSATSHALASSFDLGSFN